MRVPVRKREPLRGDDSMTPLIDVVFLLLIFFVCASVGQVAESLLPTELAAGGGVEAVVADRVETPPQPQVWLRIRNQAGRLSFNLEGRQCGSFEELAITMRQLAELSPESPLVLDVGPEVPLELLVDAWDVANRAGFESINFATAAQPTAPR